MALLSSSLLTGVINKYYSIVLGVEKSRVLNARGVEQARVSTDLHLIYLAWKENVSLLLADRSFCNIFYSFPSDANKISCRQKKYKK